MNQLKEVLLPVTLDILSIEKKTQLVLSNLERILLKIKRKSASGGTTPCMLLKRLGMIIHIKKIRESHS